MQITVPGSGTYTIETLILDLNGTLAVKGVLVAGVKERLQKISARGLRVVFFSGDTRGNGKEIAEELGIAFIKAKTAKDKLKEMKKFNASTCASVGNGLIDYYITKAARLGIVTLQAEGVHCKTLAVADVVVPSINDALDFFLDDEIFISTLRQ